ncbi:MAG: Asp-tRNA(Asn)/Glu-tRNA(Gln) amidotransferase subunit GatA [Planctomycetes bacterium]|jgi:aspartyl-tRNA(Asn)/glutamyl-tRNA(Gln) amidotransferase subunit A|nr:Asp-tRNA(Asn)/Glu-tRNA(Gln) amidotransferase subunit GatA [Planctomycetota bacterium]HPY75306.1 Asp-tRNA(Asn)/Glu-tRNA(Gln) amidotransferase subunit GatA [Planctomycetota bacterium]HQB00918.1 Asp-tRNA(Asn)/Glu-tRNA(Gln) amidotransferase subunit GatA [Planctomycetota bacterium]
MYAWEMKELLEKGEISSVDLMKNVFEKIQNFNPKYNALIELYEEYAFQEAKKSDERRKQGKVGQLEGIPLVIKDNIHMKGFAVTCASEMLQEYIATYDAFVVEQIQKQGGIIIGRTNMDEFGMGSTCTHSIYGASCNFLDPSRICGGSSGGSALAVASDMVPLALGTDTGGSVRLPASMCGVWGLKPTYGRVSRHGLIALASSMDVIGPMAQCPQDLALLFHTIAQQDIQDNTHTTFCSAHTKEKKVSGEKKKIGIIQELEFMKISPELQKSWIDAQQKIQEKGYELHMISLPHIPYCMATYYILSTAEASANLARYDGVHFATKKEGFYEFCRSIFFGEEVQRRIFMGTYFLSKENYEKWYSYAEECRHWIRIEIESAFQHVDFLMLPTSPISASLMQECTPPWEQYMGDLYTVPFSLSGHPVISIPMASLHHFPLGIQFVGQYFQEEQLLAI